MGSSQSVAVPSEEDEEEEEEEDGQHDDNNNNDINNLQQLALRKVLEQEPEMLPCHASASPLSPQLSSFGTPRLGPSIKVWDPYNVLAPPPPLPPPPTSHFHRTFSTDSVDEDRTVTEIYLISNGECHMNLRPDLIAGRCPEAALTANGKRQARALAVFLKSQGIRFSSVFTSPLDRARATALSVCQELNFPEGRIQSSDALLELSQGHWEGCHRSDIYTPETISLMERFQPDFSAPSGESLRQVEFRMVQFLNGTVMTLPEKFRSDFSPPDQSENQAFSNRGSHALVNSVHDREGPSFSSSNWDSLHRNRQGLSRKKSGKSRLQIVTTTGDHEADDEMSPREPMNPNSIRDLNVQIPTSALQSIGIFTHSTPIKCLLTALLGCSAMMSSKLCIDDSSITVIQHSWKMGWQIKRMNDTAHLRLL